jgi:hypothetical protein
MPPDFPDNWPRRLALIYVQLDIRGTCTTHCTSAGPCTVPSGEASYSRGEKGFISFNLLYGVLSIRGGNVRLLKTTSALLSEILPFCSEQKFLASYTMYYHCFFHLPSLMWDFHCIFCMAICYYLQKATVFRHTKPVRNVENEQLFFNTSTMVPF